MRRIIPAGMVYAVSPTAAVIMGDSLMYVVLPVAALDFGIHEQFGLSAAFWIGLALSINRFIRLVSNALAASVYQRFGVRWPFVASIAVGALTTLAYGLGTGPVSLLVARAVWGVSYSHMRLAALLTAFEVGTSSMRGRLVGFFNSGQRLGSLIAVTVGVLLFQLTSREVTFAALAGLGLVGVIIATRVPNLRPERIRPSGGGLRSRLNLWDLAVSRLPESERGLRLRLLSISLMRFAATFAGNGLVIATVAPYLAEFADDNEKVLGGSLAVVTLAGFLVGFRWFTDLGLGVPLGHLSDRMGRRTSIAYGMIAMFTLLAFIGAVDSLVGAIVGIPLLFLAAVGVNTALDAAIGESSPDSARAAVVGRYSTWLDLGAALGPFTGFLIADLIGFRGGFLVAAALVAGAWTLYTAVTGNPFQRRAGWTNR
ncbi:MAG: MFS transporter [Chloroflexota bacterium]|nr:MFS transporter [Chloroflexota bacterium]MDE2941446.1 MFS transporter [Chloroflexota bacterium]MDE3267636.1 MFS transporter [Chloroflexota bacterium]